MNLIQKMLIDYYEIIENDIKLRSIVMGNIEKVINCEGSSYGVAMYGCSHCGDLKFVPFCCHPNCYIGYAYFLTEDDDLDDDELEEGFYIDLF